MQFLKRYAISTTLVCLSLFVIQCKEQAKEKTSDTEQDAVETVEVSVMKTSFGTTAAGQAVAQYTLKNRNGMEVSVISYGGRITSLKVPDNKGEFADVVIGFDSLSQYTKDNPYFGALIGRYGNRIANGKFELDEKTYQLPINDGPNSLHGGPMGFDKVIWDIAAMPNQNALKLSYTSKDMEQGYPGTLTTVVTYTLTEDNTLEVAYEATTDKPTVVNLTQHSYFNLSGNFNQPIVDHEIMLNANQFLPVNKTLIPTGELRPVAGTPFDFREAKSIASGINTENDQLKKGGGYDHCWVLNNQNTGMRIAASAYHPENGRLLEVYTDEPGIQFYTGNFLDGTLPQKGGKGAYAYRTAFCLETQHYPDAPNQSDFPSTVLRPGEKYATKTIFKFSIK